VDDGDHRREALAQLAMTDTAQPRRLAPAGSAGGMALPVVSAKTVQLNDGGAIRTVHLAAPNVAGLLNVAGAPLLDSDQVEPARRRRSSTACKSR